MLSPFPVGARGIAPPFLRSLRIEGLSGCEPLLAVARFFPLAREDAGHA